MKKINKIISIIVFASMLFGLFGECDGFLADMAKKAQALETFSSKLTGEDIYTDYLFVYFPYASYKDERIYFATSQDGLNFTTLNDGNFILESTLGTHGLRDPFIIRSHDGGKYYLLATDLTVDGVTQNGIEYPGMGWSENQKKGSQSIMIWESEDLVNWSEQRMCQIATDTAGCTWAPEAYYDEETKQYIVFWASKVADDDYAKQRIYYATTQDFTTFSKAKVWIDEDWSTIDTTVIKAGEYYYRYTKNESSSENANGTPSKRIYCEKSKSMLGDWELVNKDALPISGSQIEGPTVFKFNSDDVENVRQKASLVGVTLTGDELYGLYPDRTGSTIIPGVSDDITSGMYTYLGKKTSVTAEDGTGIYSMPSPIASHGTVIPITSAEYNALQKKWAEQADTAEPPYEKEDEGDVNKSLKVSGTSKITLKISSKSKKRITLKATKTGLSGDITWKVTKGKKYIKLSKKKGKKVTVTAEKKGTAVLQISCDGKKVVKKIIVKK